MAIIAYILIKSTILVYGLVPAMWLDESNDSARFVFPSLWDAGKRVGYGVSTMSMASQRKPDAPEKGV